MSAWISREDVIAEVLAYLCSAPSHDEELLRWDMEQLIRALPAVQPDAREAALREAAAAVWAVEGGDRWTRAAAQDAILALIDKPAHVNETPKSEHDAANVLTPATQLS